MKSLITALFLLALAAFELTGCTADQRRQCRVCNFVAGKGWVCLPPEDANTYKPLAAPPENSR